MKILSAQQIKEADASTMAADSISSLELMERAARLLAKWIDDNIATAMPLTFFIGKGGNGGDGLAVARLLCSAGYKCSVYTPFSVAEMGKDTASNYAALPAEVKILDSVPQLSDSSVVVDALLGVGTTGSVSEPVASLIKHINEAGCKVISIDIPSGMIADYNPENQVIVKAWKTLTLHAPKLAMLLPEKGNYAGRISTLPLKLSDDKIISNISYTENVTIHVRDRFSHKSSYGYAVIIAGSEGMMGAAILAGRAATRSGCGLVAIHVPANERSIVQISIPEAIVSIDVDRCFSCLPGHIGKADSIGVGPGLGQSPQSFDAMKLLLETVKVPIVIDADALNLIARQPNLIPQGAILTPHIGEFRRLAGAWKNDREKLEKLRKFATKHQCIIVLKDAYTIICSPDGHLHFNSTGNPGMATAGSGDVLTGFITGLLARGYKPLEAAITGCFLHGKGGDIAARRLGEESMKAGDIVDYLPFTVDGYKLPL